MLSFQQRFDEFQAAIAEERRLFQKVKGTLPGTSNYYDAWQRAMNRTNAASEALRESSPELLLRPECFADEESTSASGALGDSPPANS